jgi:Flp pilus assembly CpaF family ATPase
MNRVMQGVMGRIRSSIPELSWAKATLISEILGHQATSLGLLIPFLLMERTEEIFLDRPESVVYFDHQEYGRCLTTVVIDRKNASELTTLLRAETNLHLDRSNPSLKADIRINGIPLRVSASIGPLSPDGFHLEIRRARLKPFTLQDLIDNGTITGEAAAILLLAVASRFNITITGGPGTGKTTLLNALDMTTPAWWRKVYIEDASESRLINGHHQVRLNVDPVDERLRGSTKNEEIIKSLHRSPDYLILGEIQTMEHSEALFQAIAAGLRVMQTCHSDSAAGLISRWGVAHHIESSSIGQMDLIVTLERPRPGESKRVVSEIVEVCRGHSDGLVKFTGLSQIYSVNGGLTTEWSSEGSFLSMADKLGLSTHMPALEGLITLIDSSSNLDIGTIPSLLWTAKHPIAYSA